MLYYGNYERQDEINERMQPLQSNVATSFIEQKPVFDIRATPTKYTTAFPIDPYRRSQYQHPPLDKTPAVPTGYNIDVESELWNKQHALQRGDIQNTYIPSSSSTLYKIPVVYSASIQPFPGLFQQNVLGGGDGLAPELKERGVGTAIVNNHTRFQMR